MGLSQGFLNRVYKEFKKMELALIQEANDVEVSESCLILMYYSDVVSGYLQAIYSYKEKRFMAIGGKVVFKRAGVYDYEPLKIVLYKLFTKTWKTPHPIRSFIGKSYGWGWSYKKKAEDPMSMPLRLVERYDYMKFNADSFCLKVHHHLN